MNRYFSFLFQQSLFLGVMSVLFNSLINHSFTFVRREFFNTNIQYLLIIFLILTALSVICLMSYFFQQKKYPCFLALLLLVLFLNFFDKISLFNSLRGLAADILFLGIPFCAAYILLLALPTQYFARKYSWNIAILISILTAIFCIHLLAYSFSYRINLDFGFYYAFITYVRRGFGLHCILLYISIYFTLNFRKFSMSKQVSKNSQNINHTETAKNHTKTQVQDSL